MKLSIGGTGGKELNKARIKMRDSILGDIDKVYARKNTHSIAMTNFTSKWSRVLYIYMVLFHSLKPVLVNGEYFMLIAGTDHRAVDMKPQIPKEFFQCISKESCTHVMKTSKGYLLVHGIDDLGKRQHEAICIYEKKGLLASSCLDFYNNGKRNNGHYKILDHNGIPFTVFCDFESEANSVWTLVSSFSLKKKQFHLSPFYNNVQRMETSHNWEDYRLGLQKMKSIRSASTIWRATCSFPTYKSDIYRDYVRAQLKDVDILEYKLDGACRRVDYINIRGNKGWDITSALWQKDFPFHIDSSRPFCKFNADNGVIADEDNFGFYGKINRAFRCTETDGSTTQYWFGGNVKDKACCWQFLFEGFLYSFH